MDRPDDPAGPLDGLDDQTLLDLYAAADAEAASVLREALAPLRRREPPPSIDALGERARAVAGSGDDELAWVVAATGLGPRLELAGRPLRGEDVVWELTQASIEPQEDPGLPAEEQAMLLAPQHVDWVGAIVELARAGAGAPADPAAIVAAIERCPEVADVPLDLDDRQLLEHAFELRMPAWQALGLVDDRRRLTEVGAWMLPRAACGAWGSDFDHPSDDEDADDTATEAAVDQLLDGLATWAEDRQLDVDLGWVGTFLDLRATYLDDQLTRWDRQDLQELLLEVGPSKLTAQPDDLPDGLRSLESFLVYLEDEGRFDDGSDPASELLAWLRHATSAVVAAMADRSRWGVSKTFAMRMLEAGVDPSDRAGVQAVMDEFNALPRAERDAVLAHVGPAADLPLQVLPSDEELAELVRGTAIWRQLTGLVAYVGDRLTLTDAGNLRLADARRLAEELGTDDVEAFERRRLGARLRSSRELAGLTRLLELAEEVEAVVREGRTARPGARAAELTQDPLGLWRDVVLAWLRRGFLGGLYADHRVWWSVELDQEVLQLLVTLVEAGRRLPLDGLADALIAAGDAPGETWSAWIRDDVHRWAEELAQAGLVELTSVRTRPDRFGEPRRQGGQVGATTLGTLLLSQVAGAPVHRTGSLRDAAAAELLDELGELPPEVASVEVDRWVAQRGPTAAADAIAASVRGGLQDRVLVAMLAFDRIGAEDARSAVESLVADDVARPYARAWLVQHGLADAELDGAESVDAMVGILAVLSRSGPDAVLAALAQLGPPDDQIELLSQAWRSSDPEALAVLEMVGDLHEDKRVRKAARKAAFKRRSATST
jgi:hypothetical protein